MLVSPQFLPYDVISYLLHVLVEVGVSVAVHLKMIAIKAEKSIRLYLRQESIFWLTKCERPVLEQPLFHLKIVLEIHRKDPGLTADSRQVTTKLRSKVT